MEHNPIKYAFDERLDIFQFCRGVPILPYLWLTRKEVEVKKMEIKKKKIKKRKIKIEKLARKSTGFSTSRGFIKHYRSTLNQKKLSFKVGANLLKCTGI